MESLVGYCRGRQSVAMPVSSLERFWERLRGLMDPMVRGWVLLDRCASVHTWGMREPCDLVWLDERGQVTRVDRDVPPRSVRWDPGAAAVLERRSHRGLWPEVGERWFFERAAA